MLFLIFIINIKIKNLIMEYQVGDKIRILHMDDDNGKDISASKYNGKIGTIEKIDSIGQLHGTWGGLAIIPDIDEIELVNESCKFSKHINESSQQTANLVEKSLWNLVNTHNIPVEYMEVKIAEEEISELDGQINVYNCIYFAKNENKKFAGWKDNSNAKKIVDIIKNNKDYTLLIFGTSNFNESFACVDENEKGWYIIWNFKEFSYIDKDYNPSTWNDYIEEDVITDKKEIQSGIYNEYQHFKNEEKDEWNKLYNY